MVARLTPGYVGADLNALVREAAKCAINRYLSFLAFSQFSVFSRIFDTIVKHNSQKRHMTNEEIRQELEKGLFTFHL